MIHAEETEVALCTPRTTVQTAFIDMSDGVVPKTSGTKASKRTDDES